MTNGATDIGVILARTHWVFDLDGTLTVPVHDFAAIRAALGVPDGADILGFLASLQAERARPLHDKLQEIEAGLARRTAAAAGAVPLIERLHRRGARLGVLTRNTRENALRTLATIGVGRFFPPASVLGREEALPKPDPDGIRKLAALWGAESQELVIVGDYLYDLQTGRAAGAATVHVDRARAFRWPELSDLQVGSLEELVLRLPAVGPAVRGVGP
jgi:HAD superfamily hydrolase (TIGR01509 family)